MGHVTMKAELKGSEGRIFMVRCFSPALEPGKNRGRGDPRAVISTLPLARESRYGKFPDTRLGLRRPGLSFGEEAVPFTIDAAAVLLPIKPQGLGFFLSFRPSLPKIGVMERDGKS